MKFLFTDPFFFDFLEECGRYDTNVNSTMYFNNIDTRLKQYNAVLYGGKVGFETEKDYMFFKLRYA